MKTMRSAAGTKPSKRKRIFDIIQIAGGNDPASRTFDMVIIVMIIVSIIITTAQTFRLPPVGIASSVRIFAISSNFIPLMTL